MNDTQRGAVTAGFLFALKDSSEVRQRWLGIASNGDWAELRVLIEETLSLAKTPTAEDIAWMHAYADRHLMPELEELHRMDARLKPQHVINGMDGRGVGGQ